MAAPVGLTGGGISLVLRILPRLASFIPLLAICLIGASAQDQGAQTKPRPEVQSLLDDAGRLVQDRKLDQALNKYKESAQVAERLKDKVGQAMAYRAIGDTSTKLNDPASALDSFQKARPLLAALGDKRGLGETCLNIAVLCVDRDPDKAVEAGQQAVDCFADLGDSQWEAVALIVVGTVQSHERKHEQAVGMFSRAANLCHSAKLSSLEGEALALLGGEFEAVGQYSVAIETYDKSLQIAKTTGNKKNEGKRLLNLGIVSHKIGQRKVAQDYFNQAIETHKTTGDDPLYTSALQNLGVSLHEDGNDVEAKKHLEQALALNKQIGDAIGEAGCLGTLGDIARRALDFDEAVEKLQGAAKLFHEQGDRESEATAIDSLGRVYLDQGKDDEAITRFDEAIKIYDELRSDSFAATSYGNKADALYDQRKLPEAEACYREAINRFELVRSNLGGLTDAKSSYLRLRVHVYQQYANVLTLLGKPDEAFDVAQKTKARGLLDLLASGDLVADADMTSEERSTERELKDKAATLSARMMGEGVENEVGAKARYAALANDLRKAEDELSKFTTSLYARHPGLASKRIAETATTVQVGQLLPDDTALVEFVVSEDAIVTVALRKVNGVLTVNGHSRPVDVGDLVKRCAALRQACATPDGDYKALAASLYTDLITPVVKDIAGKQRLILCPDACLWDLPFAVLMPSTTSYLTDDFEIDYAYSATGALAALTGDAKTSKATRDLLVCANPDFGPISRFKELAAVPGQRPIDTPSRPIDQPSRPIDQPSRPIDQPSRPIDQPSRPIDQPSRAIDAVSRAIDSLSRGEAIKSLPGTQREADGLSSLIHSATVLTGKAAQESQVKLVAKEYRYIHFATHGFVNDASPLLSTIVLAEPEKGSKDDGFLTAREIHGLELHADMVVLSACNTARGEVRSGEGIVGLTWALFVAGCPCQVVSQWSVDDASTAALMVGFYSNLTNKSQPKGTALRSAIQELRRDPKYGHPYYWAPFILVGDWH